MNREPSRATFRFTCANVADFEFVVLNALFCSIFLFCVSFTQSVTAQYERQER